MKQKLLLSCLVFLTMSFAAFAQNITVSGQITDAANGEALPGVSIYVKGTSTGTITDLDGKYTIQAPQDGILVFQAVGMTTIEQAVNNQTQMNISMQQNTTELGEVIVTSYQTFEQERSNISAQQIGSETIEARPNASFVQTLSGQVAGLNIATTSGQPGANSNIQIRGVGSVNGDTEPLFIIDGAPVDGDNFRSLNPNEIANVTVLKDAGATAIYGNRGANGVILIETKRGTFNSPLQVTYTYQFSSSSLQSNDYNLMNAQDLLAFERDNGAGRGDGMTDAEIAAAASTDWAEFFFDNGIAHNHNLQFRKGGANSTQYVSLGFLDQEGVLSASDLRRYNLRTNLTGQTDNKKFTYGVNLSLNYSESNEPNSIGGSGINRNLVLGAYQSVPYITPDDYVDGRSLLSPLSFANTPLFLIDILNTFYRREDEVKIIGSVNFNYEIIDGLSVGLRASGDFQTENRVSVEGPESFNALLFRPGGAANTTPGFADHNHLRDFLYNQIANINYTRTVGKHTFGVGAYTEYFKAHRSSFGFFQRGLDPKTFANATGTGFISDNAANDFFADDARAGLLEAGLFSYFFSGDYDFDSKYGFSGTLRRDASSRFAESNRWGTFFSVAGRWNIHNEVFAENLPFDILKLRASYGETGNQNLDASGSPFADLALTSTTFEATQGYAGLNSLQLDILGNNTLRWETIAQFNVGLDVEVFDSRLRANIDYYIKTTSDLFLGQNISSVNGQPRIDANLGRLRNSGVDLNIAYDVLRSAEPDGLNVTVSVVGNYNKNEILEFPDGLTEINDIGRVGGPLNEYFIVRTVGVNSENGELLFLDADGNETENPNPDTDRIWSGKTTIPKWQGSFNLSADFKGFFLTAQFNYNFGRHRFDNDYAGFVNPDNLGQFNFSNDILNAWTPQNTNTDIPAVTASNIRGIANTDRFLRQANFVRLRFLSFGYVVPKQYLDKTGFLRTAKVFFNAENLITFTDWRGFDVEAQVGTASRLYPTPRTWSIGVEIGI